MCYLAVLIIFVFTQLKLGSSENCTTPNKETAQCVSLFKCPILLSALGTQEAEAVRFYRSSICGGDVTNPMVCCGSASTFTVQQSVLSESFLKLLPRTGVCGLQHSDDFYHSADSSLLSDFPWLAKIHARNKVHSFLYGFYCGGALINNRYVVTAADCLLDKTHTLQYVRLGEYDSWNETDCVEDARIKDTYECSEVQDYGIEEVIPHPGFIELSMGCSFNDIGLIRLNRTVKYSDYIRPICLPLPDVSKLAVNSTITTTQCKYDYVKQKEILKVAPVERCIEEETLIEDHAYSNDGWICSETNKSQFESDRCYDLLGNPLMFSHKRRGVKWYLAGTVPGRGRDYSCYGRRVKPFTSVVFHLNWIAQTMKP